MKNAYKIFQGISENIVRALEERIDFLIFNSNLETSGPVQNGYAPNCEPPESVSSEAPLEQWWRRGSGLGPSTIGASCSPLYQSKHIKIENTRFYLSIKGFIYTVFWESWNIHEFLLIFLTAGKIGLWP